MIYFNVCVKKKRRRASDSREQLSTDLLHLRQRARLLLLRSQARDINTEDERAAAWVTRSCITARCRQKHHEWVLVLSVRHTVGPFEISASLQPQGNPPPAPHIHTHTHIARVTKRRV